MQFTINLDFTPMSPKDGQPFTEAEFVRCNRQFTFDISEIAIALVDLWNFGWENSPVVDGLGFELSLERGLSHAIRKREITERIIAPTLTQLRERGVQIFHCNHPQFLEPYPHWWMSTTENERNHTTINMTPNINHCSYNKGISEVHPPRDWTEAWKSQHTDDINNLAWLQENNKSYDQITIPELVAPKDGDLVVFSKQQFHRLMTERQIRVLFYMGFETDLCVQHSTYGIKNMHEYGYMTNIVRDCTTTFESAETCSGLWMTKVAIEQIERKWGYSTTSLALLEAVERAE